jgi:hypothetical protein
MGSGFAKASSLELCGSTVRRERTDARSGAAIFGWKLESQKRQADMPDGSIAPHCKHVLVTGCFCAADAFTPVRRELSQINTATSRWPIKKHRCGEKYSREI